MVIWKQAKRRGTERWWDAGRQAGRQQLMMEAGNSSS